MSDDDEPGQILVPIDALITADQWDALEGIARETGVDRDIVLRRLLDDALRRERQAEDSDPPL